EGVADAGGEMPGDVPGNVTVSAAGITAAGNAPGTPDDDPGDTEPGRTARADDVGPPAGDATIAAARGWYGTAGCPPVPDRAKLMAADTPMTLAAIPAATTGPHNRCREIRLLAGSGTAD